MQDDKNFKKSRKNNQSFIIHSDIKALDHHSAKQQSEEFLSQATNLFNFFHHKQKPELQTKSVVARKDDNYVVVINEPIKSILKTKNEDSPSLAAKNVEKVLNSVSLKSDSLFRFTRSIDLHSAAINTSAIENQILDLWAALETLIPKDSEANQDRIVQICNKIIPILLINYAKKLFSQITQDIKSWNNTEFTDILNKVIHKNAKSNLEKIVAFVCLEENKDIRIDIYKKLVDYPLLKNRIYELHKSFSSPLSINKSLQQHKVKLEWHLRRIYRTRSLIIHSGTFPTYTPILIEHLHNYLDLLIQKIIEFSSLNKFVSIEEIFLEMTINLHYKNNLLEKHIKENLTVDNYLEVVLGVEK